MSTFANTSLSSLPAQDMPSGVWHAHTLARAASAVLASGDALLDAQLPGGGWPLGALIELLQPVGQHHEWRLLLPALARSGQGPVVLVGAPHVPFAPALAAQGLASTRLLWVGGNTAAARLWATEQVLRCAAVDAVLAWLPQVRADQLRRLQMAAAEYHKLLWVMRPLAAQDEASPAVLRLALGFSEEAGSDALQVQVLKRRGPPLATALRLRARHARLGALLGAARPHTPAAPVPAFHFDLWGPAHALDRTAAAA